MIAERYGIQEWDMSRLTRRALALLAAEFGPADDDDNIDVERTLDDPPVPRGVPGF